MTKELFHNWGKQIWEKELIEEKRKKTILFIDAPNSHNGVDFDENFIYFPHNSTSKLQPMDISVNAPFKAKLRHIWEEWMASNDEQTNKTYFKKPTKQLFIKWVEKAWEEITSETIKNGFQHLWDTTSEKRSQLDIIFQSN